ncbi:hypothetical protein ABH944_002254 [Caballeronia udeis]|jgi:hypothetical protein|uniref:Uncharacterized protein n=1 Tax=Caballeronia udeis TaxID=1232866 RepID=A0ABW8MFZ5_9BURK
MEPSNRDVSQWAAALIRSLQLPVSPELLPDVLALLSAMADSSERIGQALREWRGGQ